LKIFKAMVEDEINLKIKCLRSERGGGYKYNEFYNFYEQYGIKRSEIEILVA